MKNNKKPIRTVKVFAHVAERARTLGITKQHFSLVLHGRRASARIMREVLKRWPDMATAKALRASGVSKKGASK